MILVINLENCILNFCSFLLISEQIYNNFSRWNLILRDNFLTKNDIFIQLNFNLIDDDLPKFSLYCSIYQIRLKFSLKF